VDELYEPEHNEQAKMHARTKIIMRKNENENESENENGNGNGNGQKRENLNILYRESDVENYFSGFSYRLRVFFFLCDDVLCGFRSSIPPGLPNFRFRFLPAFLGGFCWPFCF
jgi:hypothetical protein